jgi:integrase/recombinase XerD
MHKFCPVCGTKVEQAVAQEQEHHRYRSLPVDNETLELLREYINRGGSVPKRGKRLLFSLSRHRAWQIIKEGAVSNLPTAVRTSATIAAPRHITAK